MNKLDMAHEYMVAWMQSGSSEIIDANELASFFFSVADAMQDEADKREPKGFPDVLLIKKPNGECAHFHTTLNRTECFDCGKVLKQDDWQPDWSQSPSNMNYFFMNKDGSKYWAVNEPYMPNFTEHVMDFRNCGGDCYKSAQSQDYQGDWKQSLRKRPQ